MWYLPGMCEGLGSIPNTKVTNTKEEEEIIMLNYDCDSVKEWLESKLLHSR